MRIARCTRPLFLQLLGNKSSVAIREGWEGDIDQVIGVDGRGVAMTVVDALGPHFTPENFHLAPVSKGQKPQSQE